MDNQVLEILGFFFPMDFGAKAEFKDSETGKLIVGRLSRIPDEPLSYTHLNQLLHLNHQAGISEGMFGYYFLEKPELHPYPTGKVTAPMPDLHDTHIRSLDQLEWGLRRFYVDALLYYGNLRNAFRDLRPRASEELASLFGLKRFQTEMMKLRGPIMPLDDIPVDDRYLISELACKAYAQQQNSESLIETELIKAYRDQGQQRVRIKDIVDAATAAHPEDMQLQLALPLGTEEFAEEEISSEEELRQRVRAVMARFGTARGKALRNTQTYLSICNELDVYVATSMRNRADFRDMARNCVEIFDAQILKPYQLRYFDPTMSAANCHEDKGLIECLMVNRTRVVVYFAQDKESWGKDSEAAMALSLGKPVIIYCPPTAAGRQRMKMFRDIHPLSRLVDARTGVAVGAIITDDLGRVTTLIDRLFGNRMEYDLLHSGDGYFRLTERLTGSVVRLATNDKMLTESFWNYYHGVV